MELSFLGPNSTGLQIPMFTFGKDHSRKVLVMGGVHGDEPEGVQAAMGLLHLFQTSYKLNLCIHLVPCLNWSGMLEHQRTNFNGVDLNRNLPTKDWTPVVAKPRYNPGPSALSEPENKALVQLIDKNKYEYILSLHSWEPMLNINGDCRKLAEVIAETTGYKITEDIGYPTPGSLGTYAGAERGIPTLTYELERNLDPRKTLEIHVPAILRGLEWINKKGQ